MTRLTFALPLMLAATGIAGCDEGASPAPSEAAALAATQSVSSMPTLGEPSEDDIKAVIQRRVESRATGVSSSQKSVAVISDSIAFGEPRLLNEQDKIDGLRGDTVYPVRAKYSELRTWGNGETETVSTHYAYDFYRDEFGALNFNAKGPVQ